MNNKFLLEPQNSSLKSPKGKKNTVTKETKNQPSIQKTHSLIVKHWDDLKQEFRREDKRGKTLISLAKAYSILQKYKVVSNEEELNELKQKFIINGIYFNYIKFLRYFKTGKIDEDLFKINSILVSFIEKLREKVIFLH